jgi:tRNA threonylcarbamoyladenosine biosynthesis protein TsaB
VRVLAIETATGAAGVALASEQGVLAEATVRTARRHVELVHPLITEVLELGGLLLTDLDGVAADVGPGLFTGIRVGVSAAKALAVALGIRAIGVTSLAATAHGAVLAGIEAAEVVPVIDLRRGEVAWQLEDKVTHGSPVELAGLLADRERVLFCGDGALRYAEVFERPGWRLAGEALSSPPVASLAVLAVAALSEEKGIEPAELAPLYLREADARINWTTRHDALSGRTG